MDEQPLRLLIADDEPLAAERLQLLLAQIPDVDLVGTASDGEGAVRMADALGPDLLLLDIEMPGLDGIEVARALAAATRDGLASVGLAVTHGNPARARYASHGFTDAAEFLSVDVG